MREFNGAIRERLARITSSNRFIPEVDGFRFIAILWVLCYHINGYFAEKTLSYAVKAGASTDWLHKLCLVGNYGVELFFCISGFILAVPFAEHLLAGGPAVNLRAYFLRRVARIEPPYLIALLVYSASLLLIGKVDLFQLIPHLLASMFYLHNLIYKSISTICFVAWSLEIEVQFYLLVPLLAAVFAVSNSLLRRTLLAAAIFASANCSSGGGAPWLLPFLGYFLAGFLLADFYTLEWKKNTAVPEVWDIVATLGWILLLAVLLTRYWISFTAPWCIFLAYAGCLRGKLWRSCVTRSWLVTIGGMCYTIYLYHPLLKSLIGRATSRFTFCDYYWPNVTLQIVVLGFCIITCSALIFVATEKPFMRRDWPRRFLNALRSY